MAPSVVPPQLKVLTAFVRRAEELDEDRSDHDASLLAYYCRAYAIDKGIKLRIDDPAVNEFLFGLMDLLELTKKTLKVNNETDSITCENYAYNIFTKADEEYRSGDSTKKTAQLFYAASTYYDVLEQFGPLDEELLEKRKYAKWKAADILKAIQAGRRPDLPESKDEDPDMFAAIPKAPTSLPPPLKQYDAAKSDAPSYPSHSPPTYSPPPSSAPPSYTAPPPIQQQYQPPPQQYQPPPQQHQPPVQQHQPPPQLQYQSIQQHSNPMLSAGSSSNNSSSHGSTSQSKGIKDSMEFASFAIAALKHNDVALAKQRLTAALKALE